MKKRLLTPLLAICPLFLQGQTATDHNHGLDLTYDAYYGDFTLGFWGMDGWTYFIQQSQDLENWTYIPTLEEGRDSAEHYGFYYSLPNYGDAVFMRLKMTDLPTTDAWADDFDGDSFSNELELNIGTDPLDATDDDTNGIPDDVDAYWASVDPAWKTSIVNDSNADFYDPDGLITAEADILPNGDYDGDSISNLEEYVNGTATDAMDYFNGATVFPQVLTGDRETAPPNTYLTPYLSVAIYNISGEALINAPVIFSTTGAYLSEDQTGATPLTTSYRTTTDIDGAKVAYFTPSSTGTTSVTASFPNGMSLDIEVITVSAASAAKQSIRDFQMTENSDGTYTYTWTSDADSGGWLRIQDRQGDNSWGTIYETTYGSSELPYVFGQNTYSLKLDASNNYISN